MTRRSDSPGTKAYYEALQSIFRLESGVLTATLPHMGERGRNDEDRFRAFLAKVLPRRFSIGTGFLVCSNPDIPHSRQTDVVIYDEIHNSPLHRELAAYVFPVEMVYGTVEVKGLLGPGDLVPALQNIARIRRLAKEKHYLVYGQTSAGQENPDQSWVVPIEQVNGLAPRAFIFAYDTKWKSATGFVNALKNAIAKVPNTHVHGVAVLAKEWFAYQVPERSGNGFRIKHFTDHTLLRFINRMIHSLASVPMQQMSIDRYLNTEAPSNTSLQPTLQKQRG
jgi:hypothetical protein